MLAGSLRRGVLALTCPIHSSSALTARKRQLIENFFCKLKEFKRIAMPADKNDQSFAAMIRLVAAVVNSP